MRAIEPKRRRPQQVKEANIRQRRWRRIALQPALFTRGASRGPDAGGDQAGARRVCQFDDTPAAAPRPAELRKGLTVEEVDAILGRPETILSAPRDADGEHVALSSRERRVTAEFVEGVLIRFIITSP